MQSLPRCVLIELPVHLHETTADEGAPVVSPASLSSAISALGGTHLLTRTLRQHVRETKTYKEEIRKSGKKSTTSKKRHNARIERNISDPASQYGTDVASTLEFKFTPTNPFSSPILATRVPDPSSTTKYDDSQTVDCYLYDTKKGKITKRVETMYRFNCLAPYEVIPHRLDLPSWDEDAPSKDSVTSSASMSSAAYAATKVGPLPIKVSDWAHMPRTFLRPMSQLGEKRERAQQNKLKGTDKVSVDYLEQSRRRIERTKKKQTLILTWIVHFQLVSRKGLPTI